MQTNNGKEIEQAKKAALEVLLHNAHGPLSRLAPNSRLGISRTLYTGSDDFHSGDSSFRKSKIA